MRRVLLAAAALAIAASAAAHAQGGPGGWVAAPPYVTAWGPRNCTLAAIASDGEGDQEVIAFESVGGVVNLTVARKSRPFQPGVFGLPVLIDDQPFSTLESFATRESMRAPLIYDGPWHWMFKALRKGHRMTVNAGHDYTVSLDGFGDAYDQWIACVSRPGPTQ